MTAAPPLARAVRADPTVRLPLRLVSARHRAFGPDGDTDGGADTGADTGVQPAVERYLRDLVASRDGTFRPEALRAGAGTSFSTMAHDLVGGIGPEWPSVDLIVLCHAVPELNPGTSPACSLVDAAPGTPVAFTLCDQGRVAPFSALRVAGAYLDSVPLRRALVLVLDQSTVPWEVDDRADLPSRDLGVALVLDRVPARPDGGLLLQQHAGVDPGQVGEVLRARLPALTTQPGPVRVVAGAGVPPGQLTGLDVPVVAGPAGLLCTSGWAYLSEATRSTATPGGGDPPGTGAPGRLVLVEYESRLRHLSLAAVDLPATTGPGGRDR
ncbi:hypothetical protein [Plantactinospora sp. BC1]|uniref:hypothetical protein n=1 Tax=Plantactinospora sp. BC1 TaxID=2108470 RepID=UPI00131EE433|nr:hypothetical protein [Plantactinospora sp. BC1]